LKSHDDTWKVGFKTRLLSLVIAIAFAIAMRSEYVPAVFVMALVAIFVAAEHYGGLHKSSQMLTAVQGALHDSNSVLETAREHIGKMEESLRTSNEELRQSKNLLADQRTILVHAKKTLEDQQIRVERLANSFRLAKFKPEVYLAYSLANDRIDAVIRVFDIDSVWWQQDAEDPWTTYKNLPNTLYWALTATTPGHTSTSDAAPAIRTDQVLFVCEMPWPTTFFQEQGGDSKEKRVERFNDLLGLTWWLVVLRHVRLCRRTQLMQRSADTRGAPFPYVRMATAHCPSWMHAVDQTVFQMTQGERWDQSSVSDLTMSQDELARRRLSNWAHDNIRHHARRGREAESYVCTLFLYAAAKTKHLIGESLDNALDGILRALGLDEWLELRIPDLGVSKLENKRQNTERLCRRLFSDFLTTVDISVESELLTSPSSRVVTFEHLIATLS
jgi:hypothetical protein